VAIHPTAVVDRAAEIDPSVEVGPYAVIDGPVKIDPEVRIYPHAYLTGWTEVGPGCRIHPFAVIGHLPQDSHFTGERTYCRIGAGTVIREHASVHRGTQPESATIIGQNCFLLAGAHVGHNCVLGDRVTLINGAQLAGHVQIGEGAVVSANAMFHQFVRVGEHTMIGGGTPVTMDVPPFMTVPGRNACSGINLVGMRRNGFSRPEIDELRRAYRVLYRTPQPIPRLIEQLETRIETPAGRRLLAFLKAPSRRGLAIGVRHAYRRSAESPDEES